jgi:hypothetical protein
MLDTLYFGIETGIYFINISREIKKKKIDLGQT